MEVRNHKNNLIITGLKDFDLKHIFDCGQCFRFNAVDENTYIGVAKGKALKISQSGGAVTLYDTAESDFYNIWFDYFDLGTDYGGIKSELAKDDVMREAVSYGRGIRILRQDLWESIISFIISASNNIPRIKGIIERLCAMCGGEIEYMGDIYYSFPSPDDMASLSKEDLAPIRAGFRDKYILDAVSRFTSGELSEEYIRSLPSPDAKKELLRINGVGSKVANCIMLFGLSRTDSFPIDVWIKRVMEYFYFDGAQSKAAIASLARDKFSNLGGYAQQYLFFYARENKISDSG